MTCKRLKVEENPSHFVDFLYSETAFLAIIFAASRTFSTIPTGCFLYGTLFIMVYFWSESMSEKLKFLRFAPVLLLITPAIFGFSEMRFRLANIANALLTAVFVRFHAAVDLLETGKCGFLSLMFFSAAAAYAVAAAVRKRNIFVNFAVGAVVILLAAVFANDGISFALATAAALILIFYVRNEHGFAAVFVHAGAVCTAFLMILNSEFALALTENARDSIENIRQSDRGFCVPNGEISSAESFLPDDSPALEVVMSEPQPMYLHGFLGYNYENGRWTEPDFSEMSDRIDDFSYLRSQDLTADSQALELVRLSGGDEISVTIRNTGADNRYKYLPNGSETETDSTKSYALKLENYSNFRTKNQTTEIKAVSNLTDLLDDFPDIILNLQAENSDTAAKYLENSAVIDRIYKENFSSVDENIARILNAQLSSYSCERGDLSAAVNVVYDYLGGFSYDPSAEKLSLEDFLQIEKSGYSIHFASAAVEIFRYYGIPARYAEGYAVTYEDAKGKLSGSPIKLTDENFHAWAEVYMEGVGWIPIEVTPDYFDKMPLPSGVSAKKVGSETSAAKGNAGDFDVVSGERTAEKIIDETESDEQLPVFLSAIIAAAVLVMLLIVAVLRRISFKKKLKTDSAFALSQCVKMLAVLSEVPLDSGGSYDFSAIENDDLKAKLCDLQSDCINEYYANNFFIYTIGVKRGEVYYDCRKIAFKNMNISEKIKVIFGEIF